MSFHSYDCTYFVTITLHGRKIMEKYKRRDAKAGKATNFVFFWDDDHALVRGTHF